MAEEGFQLSENLSVGVFFVIFYVKLTFFSYLFYRNNILARFLFSI